MSPHYLSLDSLPSQPCFHLLVARWLSATSDLHHSSLATSAVRWYFFSNHSAKMSTPDQGHTALTLVRPGSCDPHGAWWRGQPYTDSRNFSAWIVLVPARKLCGNLPQSKHPWWLLVTTTLFVLQVEAVRLSPHAGGSSSEGICDTYCSCRLAPDLSEFPPCST